MPTDIERASDPTTPPGDLADILTRWKSSRHSNWAIVHALARNAALPEECLLDLAWSCQADAVFNSATFLQLFADPGLGDRLAGAICRPGPKDERPRDPELFDGFLRWLAEGTDVPTWLSEAMLHQHALRFASHMGAETMPLVTSRSIRAFEAVCRNPNAPPPDLRPKDEAHRAHLLMLVSGATGPFAAQIPHTETTMRDRFFGHPLWRRIDGPIALALDAGRPDENEPPNFRVKAWPTFAVANGWTKTFHFPEGWTMLMRIGFVEAHDEALKRGDPTFGSDIRALAKEVRQAAAALARPEARDARRALGATEHGREIRQSLLFSRLPSVGRIVALLAEAKEDADEDLANQLFALSMSSTMTATANPKAASKALSSLHETWARLDERRAAQLWNAIATDVRIGIELHRIVSAEGRQDAVDWKNGESGDRLHTVFRVDAEGPDGFSWDVNANDPNLLTALERLRLDCTVSALRKALAPFATEA